REVQRASPWSCRRFADSRANRPNVSASGSLSDQRPRGNASFPRRCDLRGLISCPAPGVPEPSPEALRPGAAGLSRPRPYTPAMRRWVCIVALLAGFAGDEYVRGIRLREPVAVERLIDSG